jgi:hypothetical protein
MADVNTVLTAALISGGIALIGVIVNAAVTQAVAQQSTRNARGNELLRLEHASYMGMMRAVHDIGKNLLLTDDVAFPTAEQVQSGLKMLQRLENDIVLLAHDRKAVEAAIHFDEVAKRLAAGWTTERLPNGRVTTAHLRAATQFRQAQGLMLVGIRRAMRSL